MCRSVTLKKYKIITLIVGVFIYLVWYIIFDLTNLKDAFPSDAIFILSWIGLLTIMVVLLFWAKFLGKFFSPIIIFLCFFAMFNFGQCILWAVGIHSNAELGVKKIYGVLAEQGNIYKAQMMFIICFITFNIGAIISQQDKKMHSVESIVNAESNSKYDALFYASVFLAIYSIPTTLVRAFFLMYYSRMYGYHDLYYGTIANSAVISHVFFVWGSQLFFPNLLGLLIGSRYKNSIRIFVYTVFGLYAFLALLCGDRGEWIRPLIILIWADLNLYKKRSKKNIALLFVCAVLALYFVDAIVKLRNVGISLTAVKEYLSSSQDNFLISQIMEYGQSMGIVVILFQMPVTPMYGNTYLMSIPTLFGTNLGMKIFGFEYVQLHTWFPFQFLKIRSGTDFSIIGEAMLNYGVYSAPLILFIEGYIIGKICAVPFREDSSPLRLTLSLACITSITKLARSTVWLMLNEIVYYCLFFVIAYLMVQALLPRFSLHYGREKT